MAKLGYQFDGKTIGVFQAECFNIISDQIAATQAKMQEEAIEKQKQKMRRR